MKTQISKKSFNHMISECDKWIKELNELSKQKISFMQMLQILDEIQAQQDKKKFIKNHFEAIGE